MSRETPKASACQEGHPGRDICNEYAGSNWIASVQCDSRVSHVREFGDLLFQSNSRLIFGYNNSDNGLAGAHYLYVNVYARTVMDNNWLRVNLIIHELKASEL